MGNNLVGQVNDAMEKYRPDKTVIKIWNKGKLCVILAAKNPAEWEMEMDPYYIYADGKVSGISYIDNGDVMKKVLKPENLIYHDPSID